MNIIIVIGKILTPIIIVLIVIGICYALTRILSKNAIKILTNGKMWFALSMSLIILGGILWIFYVIGGIIWEVVRSWIQ